MWTGCLPGTVAPKTCFLLTVLCEIRTYFLWLIVCLFLSTCNWNAANSHSWYGLYYETRNYFNCSSNSLPIAVNKMISSSSSLTHVALDKRAARSHQGWCEGCVGAAASPLAWTAGPGLGLQPARGCCWGRDPPLGPLLHPVLTELSLHRLCFAPSQRHIFTSHFNVSRLETVLA